MPLGELVAALEAALPAEEVRAKIAVDRGRLSAVCAKLEALLANDDAEAADVLDENTDLLHTAFPNHYRRIAGTIESFDFEAALAVLKDAVATAT